MGSEMCIRDRLGDALDVIAKDLAVALGAALSESLASLSTSRHVVRVSVFVLWRAGSDGLRFCTRHGPIEPRGRMLASHWLIKIQLEPITWL